MALVVATLAMSAALGDTLRLRRLAESVGHGDRFVEVSRGMVSLVRRFAFDSVVDARQGPLLVQPCDASARADAETYRDATPLRVSRIFSGTRADVTTGLEAREGAHLRREIRATLVALGLAIDAMARAISSG